MKKAKLMLSAIPIVAVVGGALAFTANRNPITIYTGTKGSGTCTTPCLGALGCDTHKVAASTTSLVFGCPDVFICAEEAK